MAFSSTTFHMPGSFHAEGVHPGLFRPPTSPASSSGYLPNRPTPTTETTSRNKRKSFGQDYSESRLRDSDYQQHQGGNAMGGTFSMGASGVNPFLGRTYKLAGQLDTPGLTSRDREILGDSMYSDVDYRTALGTKRTRDDVDYGNVDGPTQLFPLPSQPAPPRGWSSSALSTIGGAFGKIWQFCTFSAFNGFHAGGGNGYDVTPSGDIEEVPPVNPEVREKHFQRHVPGYFPEVDRRASYGYIEKEYDGKDYPSRESTPSRPSAKRRQTDRSDELGNNWVIVKEPRKSEMHSPHRSTPPVRPPLRNRNGSASVTTGRRISTPSSRLTTTTTTVIAPVVRNTPSRLSFAGGPSRHNDFSHARTSSASFASPRSPSPTKARQASMAGARPSSSCAIRPTHSRQGSFKAPGKPPQHTPSRPSHRRHNSTSNASTASPRSSTPTATTTSHHLQRPSSSRESTIGGGGGGLSRKSTASSRHSTTPTTSGYVAAEQSPRLDAEAKKLAARRKMTERDTDVKMSAFNKRLQDMIQQGREALGSTVEVDGDGGDYDDDDHYGKGGRSRWEDEGA